jgi:hypothetical protein
MAAPVRLLVCTGGDCRRAPGFDEVMLLARVSEGASTVACQGVCKGPVVGVERDGELRWYAKVRGDQQVALARLVRSGRGRGALRALEIRKRRGRLKRPSKRRPIDPARRG